MNSRNQSGPWEPLLYLVAGVFAIAIGAAAILSFLPQQPAVLLLLALPGRYLFESFHFAALYLPAFLLFLGILLRTGKLSPGRLAGGLAAFLPTVSLALALRLMFTDHEAGSPILDWAIQVFAVEGAVAVSSIFTLFSGVIVSQLPGWIDRRVQLPAQDQVQVGDRDADIRADSWFYEDTGASKEEIARGGAEKADATVADDVAEAAEAADAAEADELEPQETESESENTPEAVVVKDEEVQDISDLEELVPVDQALVDFEEDEGTMRDPAETTEATVGREAAVDTQSSEEEELEVFFSRGRLNPADAVAAQTEEPLTVELETAEEVDETAYFEAGEDEAGEIAEIGQEVEESDEAAIDLVEADDPVDESVLPPPEPAKFTGPYDVPIRGLLDLTENEDHWQIDKAATDSAEVLQNTLQEFGIQAEVTGIRKGPVITMFEILPAPGVKLTRIVNLADNIALRLAAASVRIVAPIPGKHAVGIEIPNKNRHLVGFGELLQDPLFHDPRHEIPVALGKDITGDAQIVDLTKTPHLLIAGATGSGKSVCVNSLICSVLYRRSPEEIRMILIDPKIVELKFYNDIPHLLTPVITDPKKAYQALQWCIYEMERRYTLLDAMAVRDIKSYNKKIRAKQIATTTLPYIMVVVDEFADLMATTGKELEGTLARLAAMSRAVGIHLVLATQRPSTDVITGLIKANIPSRIAFMVASKIDSRIILDAMGAEKLLGKGDMLFTSAWNPFPTRMQGAFLSEEEVERVVAHVRTLGKPDYIDDEIFIEDEDDETFYQQDLEDPLMEKAIEIVVNAGKASASYLQRRLKVGYNRAARMVELLEEMGIVGPQNGSKAREILKSPDLVR